MYRYIKSNFDPNDYEELMHIVIEFEEEGEISLPIASSNKTVDIKI